MAEFINNVCRICLSGENELLEIDSEFIVEDKPFYLETVLLQIGGIKMKRNSEIPSSICSSCLDEAIAANTFRQKCQTSDKILQQFIKQVRSLSKDGDYHMSDGVIPELTLVCVGNTDTKANVKIEPRKHQPETTGGSQQQSGSVKKYIGRRLMSLNDDVLVTCMEEYYTDSMLSTEFGHESSLSRYKCNMCYDVFSDETELISHLRIKHSIAQYQCKLCSELFSTSVEVHIHMSEHKQTTTGVKQEIQWEPGSHHDDDDDDDDEDYSDHQDYNTGIKKMELVCYICSKVYKDKTCLLKHIYLHQTGRIHSSYVCDYCGKGFRNRCKLSIHISGLHLNIRPYQCALCLKRFKSKRDLLTHYRTHTKIKKFSCSICGIGLVDKRALIQHERIHNEDRPYTCDVCGRGFVCTARRNTHKITAHTKPTKKCPNCPALFHLNSMVNTHIKKVHLKTDRRRKPNRTTRQHTGHT